MSEPANQSRPSIKDRGLKRQSLKQSISDGLRGGIQWLLLVTVRELMWFLSINACKSILIVNQNKMINQLLSIICLLYGQIKGIV